MGTDDTVQSLATRAASAFKAYRDGDVRAMDEPVDLLTPVLWHTARAQGVPDGVAQDAVQTAWLRLVESGSGSRTRRPSWAGSSSPCAARHGECTRQRP